MIKVSDFIAKYLYQHGIKEMFIISGGGAMHLNDSFGVSKIRYFCNHNEQASAICGEGYARVNQKIALVNVTTGPGGLNCLNGVFGAWTDSAPILFISGQVKFSTTKASCPNIPLRQLGDQEVDIVSVVKPLTKYAVMVTKAEDIKYHLERAIYEATSGRKGPVWLDIPINIQAALIDEKNLKGFTPPAKPKYNLKIKEVATELKKAKRPLIVAGHGLRLSGQINNFKKLVKKLNIPVAGTLNGFDLIETSHPNFIGRIGTIGQRAGNFALQQADVILFLGTRNNIRQASYNYENFAKNAKKIIVDIDAAELKKPTVKPNIAVLADLADFIPALLKNAVKLNADAWLKHCQKLKAKYTPLREFKIKQNNPINPYLFVEKLTEQLTEGANVVASNGTAIVSLFQAAKVKQNQRMIVNSGDASMGYGLPAAIGAAVAAKKEIICLEGDGSIMMNLQELQTVKNYNLPIKIFILNNAGYISIIQTQRNFFGRFTACNKQTGVDLPDFKKIAAGFDLPYVCLKKNADLGAKLKQVLSKKGPLVCEVMLEKDYIFAPKLSSKKLPDGTMVSPSLEDMYPFLSREEMEENAKL